MKKIKCLLFSVIIGVAIGLWFGVNIGKDKPFYSNPFAEPTLKQKAKDKASEVIEDTKRAIKQSLD